MANITFVPLTNRRHPKSTRKGKQPHNGEEERRLASEQPLTPPLHFVVPTLRI